MTPEFKDNSGQVMKAFDTKFRSALILSGEAVRKTAHDLARKDTGNMANSIDTRPDNPVDEIIIFCPTDYAVWNEFGTRFMEAQPFMVPGLNENISKINGFFNLARG